MKYELFFFHHALTFRTLAHCTYLQRATAYANASAFDKSKSISNFFNQTPLTDEVFNFLFRSALTALYKQL